MKASIIVYMIKTLYGAGLRDLLVQAINDPEKKWDDAIVCALDALLGYDNGGERQIDEA